MPHFTEPTTHYWQQLLPPEAAPAQRSVALLGHGLGGMVAQEVVMRRPDLVNRLVLSASTSGPDSGWANEAQRQSVLLDGVANDMQQLTDAVLPGQTGPLALPAGVQLARYCMGQLSPVTYRLALQAQAARDGLQWVRATPRQTEGQVQQVLVGLRSGERGPELAVLDVLDALGQRSLLQFSGFEANPSFKADAFAFHPPAGVDVIRP